MKQHQYLLPLEKQFLKHADQEKAAEFKAYLRNQFEHYGIATPLRRSLCKEQMKKALPEYARIGGIVKTAWGRPQREWHYFAVELIAALKKKWDEDLIHLIEYLIIHKSWWDSVDHIASELSGPYFKLFPKQISGVTGRWNKSGNIWLQRSSIMFQKAYKDQTDQALLSRHILRHAHSNEFFIQKAIGWALREYSKTDPSWVEEFVKNHQLAPLSSREALKRIKK